MGRLRKNTTRFRGTGWLQRLSKRGKIAAEGIFRTSSTVSHYPAKGGGHDDDNGSFYACIGAHRSRGPGLPDLQKREMTAFGWLPSGHFYS